MSKELLERIDELEEEGFELKREIRFMEENLESLDAAYTEACNLLYDCKVTIQRVLDGEAGSKELMELLQEIKLLDRKEEFQDASKE